jgi:hypothetical protein
LAAPIPILASVPDSVSPNTAFVSIGQSFDLCLNSIALKVIWFVDVLSLFYKLMCDQMDLMKIKIAGVIYCAVAILIVIM